MSVDAKLYVPNAHTPEYLAAAWLMAHGEPFPQNESSTGEKSDNVFAATSVMRRGHETAYGFAVVEEPEFTYLHTADIGDPWAGAWYFSTRSYPKAIAAFEAIAHTLGGLVIYADFDDKGHLFGRDDDMYPYSFKGWMDALHDIKPLSVTAEHRKLAAYS